MCARNLRVVGDGRLIICENDSAESVNLYAHDANGTRVTRPFPFFETAMVFGVVFPGRYEEYGTRVHTFVGCFLPERRLRGHDDGVR